jgi:hypothetical protein
MSELFEKPQVEMQIDEKPKKKKKNFTPEQKQAFVERMKKAREAKLLKKAQELNAKQSQSNPPPSNVATTDVIEEKPKKTRKPRVKKDQPIVQPPQPHINYDYTHINNLNSSINMLNQNLMNLATRSQPKPSTAQPTSEPKSEPQVVEKEKEIKIEPLKEPPQVQKIKMAEIPQHVTTNENPIQKRKIWNATRRAFVYI